MIRYASVATDRPGIQDHVDWDQPLHPATAPKPEVPGLWSPHDPLPKGLRVIRKF